MEDATTEQAHDPGNTGQVGAKAPYDLIYRSVSQSTTLSLRALGLYCYLVSKPDGWRFDFRSLSRDRGEGQHSIRGALKELRDAGLYVQVKTRNEAGQWATRNVLVSDPAHFTEDRVADIATRNRVAETGHSETATYRDSEREISSSLRELDRQPKTRRLSDQEKIAIEEIERHVVPVIKAGGGFDSTLEFGRAWRASWDRCAELGLSPTPAGVFLGCRYMELLGHEPEPKKIAALVGQTGVFALKGLESSIGRDLSGDWLPYALEVAKAKLAEVRQRRSTG